MKIWDTLPAEYIPFLKLVPDQDVSAPCSYISCGEQNICLSTAVKTSEKKNHTKI